MAAKASQEVKMACEMVDRLMTAFQTRAYAVKLAAKVHGVSLGTLYAYLKNKSIQKDAKQKKNK